MITTEQAKERNNGIGASDAPIITGHSPFMTAFELYKIKRGELDSDVSGAKVDAGNFLESGIAALFTHKTGTETFLAPDTIYHPDHPFIFCHLDRTIRNGIPFEIKNTTQADLWGYEEDGPEGIPVPVHIQVLHQMACTGANMAAVACLLFGYDLRVYEIPRDDDIIKMIIENELEFWDRVQTGNPPQIEYNHSTTTEMMRRVFKGTNLQTIDLPDEAMEWHTRRVGALAEQKQAKALADGYKARIQVAMGENAIGKLSDGSCYKRKPNKKGVISMKHSTYTPEG